VVGECGSAAFCSCSACLLALLVVALLPKKGGAALLAGPGDLAGGLLYPLQTLVGAFPQLLLALLGFPRCDPLGCGHREGAAWLAWDLVLGGHIA